MATKTTQAATTSATATNSKSNSNDPSRIGETAGIVWQYLAKTKEATADKITKETKVSANLVHQAIGWLAREDKIQFTPQGKYVKISLKHGV